MNYILHIEFWTWNSRIHQRKYTAQGKYANEALFLITITYIKVECTQSCSMSACGCKSTTHVVARKCSSLHLMYVYFNIIIPQYSQKNKNYNTLGSKSFVTQT